MHEPLTAAEYRAIAANLQFPSNAFIDGAFRPASSGRTYETTNPATGETLAEVAACDSTDVDFAVTKVVSDIEALKGMDNMRMTPLDIPYTRMVWFNQYDK